MAMTQNEPLAALLPADFEIEALGRCLLPSPIARNLGDRGLMAVGEAGKVLVDDSLSHLKATARAAAADDVAGGLRAAAAPADAVPPDTLPPDAGSATPEAADAAERAVRGELAFELAGPRDRVFFDPRTVRAAIVTCGGLCPGLNNVVRGIVLELVQGYGVRQVLGYRFGYEGLISRYGHLPLPMTPESVAHIHHEGGTVLGSSRGEQDPAEVVDNLEANGIGMLFVVGGDGTMRGAMRIAAEVRRRGLKIAVVGVPKTIDNDIPFIDRSFGFVSAYSAAVDVIRAARVEAMGARDGIGVVKLMGRHAGFLACQAALASTEVDVVLVPEVPAGYGDDDPVFRHLDRVLDTKGHAVVVVAEGAAQELLPDEGGARQDRSGNVKLKDVGPFVRDRIGARYAARRREVTVKYIDPSYQIRSVAACPSDSIYCWNMARHAVHAAMAGNTAMLIGRWHGRFVHVPMALATRNRRQLDPEGDLWMSVIEATGQPRLLV